MGAVYKKHRNVLFLTADVQKQGLLWGPMYVQRVDLWPHHINKSLVQIKPQK